MKYRYLLYIAYACWGIPLIAAIICLTGYWLSRNLFFPSVGIVVLLSGVFVAVIGFTCIAVFVFLNRETSAPVKRATRRKGIVAAGLLILNFPIAFLFLMVGSYLGDSIYLEIVNQTSGRFKL